VRPLVVGEHDLGVVAQLAIPLALRQQEPVERLGQAAFQGVPEERLRVADEADLAAAQTCLLPEQPHQAVGVGTGGGVTLPVGDKEESSLTSSRDARRNCDGFGMVSPESWRSPVFHSQFSSGGKTSIVSEISERFFLTSFLGSLLIKDV